MDFLGGIRSARGSPKRRNVLGRDIPRPPSHQNGQALVHSTAEALLGRFGRWDAEALKARRRGLRLSRACAALVRGQNGCVRVCACWRLPSFWLKGNQQDDRLFGVLTHTRNLCVIAKKNSLVPCDAPNDFCLAYRGTLRGVKEVWPRFRCVSLFEGTGGAS